MREAVHATRERDGDIGGAADVRHREQVMRVRRRDERRDGRLVERRDRDAELVAALDDDLQVVAPLADARRDERLRLARLRQRRDLAAVLGAVAARRRRGVSRGHDARVRGLAVAGERDRDLRRRHHVDLRRHAERERVDRVVVEVDVRVRVDQPGEQRGVRRRGHELRARRDGDLRGRPERDDAAAADEDGLAREHALAVEHADTRDREVDRTDRAGRPRRMRAADQPDDERTAMQHTRTLARRQFSRVAWMAVSTTRANRARVASSNSVVYGRWMKPARPWPIMWAMS